MAKGGGEIDSKTTLQLKTKKNVSLSFCVFFIFRSKKEKKSIVKCQSKRICFSSETRPGQIILVVKADCSRSRGRGFESRRRKTGWMLIVDRFHPTQPATLE